MEHNLNKIGYFLNSYGQIEAIKYRDYLERFGSDETTTPKGVAPRLYVEGKNIYSWGIRGNNHCFYASFSNNRDAVKRLFEIWESNLSKLWDTPQFFTTKKELFEELAEQHQKDVKVIKRYFRLQDFLEKRAKEVKQKFDNRPSFTKEMIIDYILANRVSISENLKELDELKEREEKELWQVKANTLIQKVSNNDFRILKWKEIYNLIRKQLKK